MGPVGLVVLVILLVMGIGYWAVGGKLDKSITGGGAEQPKSAQPKAPAPTAGSGSTAAPAQTPAAPAKTEPVPDPNQAIIEARRQIDRSGGKPDTMLVTLYYADGLKNAEVLQPVEVRVPQTVSVVKTIAEQLVAAPANLKLYSGVPAGTSVRGVNFDSKTGVATVDLSPEAAGVQGSAAAMNIQASFVYSLTAINSVKSVQLWVNGRPATLHGVEWNKPLTRAELEARNYFRTAPVIKFEPKS